ncbi:MAG: GNAT family N-acetyltransferase [Christensenellales bacterium]
MKLVKYNEKYLDGVDEIYNNSFPECERYIPMQEMVELNDTEMHCLVDDDNKVHGFMYTILNDKSVFILYLAVKEEDRSKGYGGQMMKWCLHNYKDRNVFLNIDELSEQKEDFDIRLRRLKFYERNGLFLTDVMSQDEDENFHVLSSKPTVDMQEYIALDNFVAKVLDADLSIITKVDLMKKYSRALQEQVPEEVDVKNMVKDNEK